MKEPKFQEIQKFDQPLFLVVVWLGPLIMGLIIIYQIFSNTFSVADGDGLTLALMFVFLVITSFILQNIQLHTKVSEEYIHLKFPYMTKKDIAIADITKAELVTYSPLKDYGGWGIRWGKEGKAYNIKGNQGIKLLIKGREKFLVGSQKSEELASILKEMNVTFES